MTTVLTCRPCIILKNESYCTSPYTVHSIRGTPTDKKEYISQLVLQYGTDQENDLVRLEQSVCPKERQDKTRQDLLFDHHGEMKSET